LQQIQRNPTAPSLHYGTLEILYLAGIGGVPFLLPLLCQVGLGFTPIQSGLLVMPQAIAAMSMKAIMLRLLRKVGYRGVLISNTLTLGALLMILATIGLGTPVWGIVLRHSSKDRLLHCSTRA
jgi:hypothetical protein